jgi:hypothetical protein
MRPREETDAAVHPFNLKYYKDIFIMVIIMTVISFSYLISEKVMKRKTKH